MEQLHTMQQYSGNNATDHNYYSHDTHYHEPPKIEPEIHQQHFSSHQHFYHAEPENGSNSSYYDLVTGNFKNSPTGETLISKDVNEQELSQAEMANLKGWSNVQPLQSLQGNTQNKVQSQVRSQVHGQVQTQSRIQSHTNPGHHYNQNVKTEYIQTNMQNGNNHVQNGQNYQNGRIQVQQQQSQFQIKSEIQHFQNNGQHNGPIYGHASGKINGHLNGHQNGHYNGHHNGHHNGHQNSHQNGHHDGRYQNGHHTGNQHNYPNSGHNVTKTNNSNHQSNQPPQFQPQIFTNYEESETSSSLNSPNPNSPSINYAERPDQDEAGRFNCKKCEKSFKTQTTLYQHMRVKHAANRRRQVNCDLCKLQFPIKEKLLKHYDSAMHVLCEDNPEYLAAFHQHINYENQDKDWDTRPFKCRTCDTEHTKYAQPHDAFKHVAKVHFHGNVVQKNHHYKCNECAMVWKSKSRLEVHFLQEHAEPSLECDICHKKWGWICDLQTHREWRHREALLKSDNVENNHEEYRSEKINQSSADISLNCTVIEDDASLKLNSNVMKQTNGTMPCRICRVALTDDELRDHYQINHNDACRRDDGFFHCDTCVEHFDNRVQMLNHREGKHNIGGRYYCDVCDLPFAKEEVLFAHRGRELHKFVQSERRFVEYYHKHSVKTHPDGPECTICGHKDGTCVKMLTHFFKQHQTDFFESLEKGMEDDEEIEIQIQSDD